LPDTRTHRGLDPRDGSAFAEPVRPKLIEAVHDLSWLLSRGYAERSASKLVGDRLSLTERQRMAVKRSACSDASLSRRRAHQCSLEQLRGRTLLIDGFNVLTTLEGALSGGVILLGSDGAYRDLLGVHGSYRKVLETRPALILLGELLAARGVAPVVWYLDSPVSNSGRLKKEILDIASTRGWQWEVELVFNPDPILSQSADFVATADSAILDRCSGWVALAREAIEAAVPSAFVVDLAGDA
jgi:hypothetical protein